MSWALLVLLVLSNAFWLLVVAGLGRKLACTESQLQDAQTQRDAALKASLEAEQTNVALHEAVAHLWPMRRCH